MLKMHGISKNIIRPILGRISFSSVMNEERSLTFLFNPALPEKELKEYAGLIFSQANEGDRIKSYEIPVVYNVKKSESLLEGDVVEILPNGTINVLYQIRSKHNVIFVTSKCDCHCIMCPQPDEESGESLTDLNLKLISLMSKETQEIALTGGEPTLVGYDLFKLILACRDLLPKTSLLLLTNGRKFSDFKYAHFFSSLCHPNMTVGIPLYGDNNIEHDAIMGSKGAFDETVRGVLNLASFNNPIEIRTVIIKQTYDKLSRISEFIYRNLTFTRHVAFMGLETIGRGRQNLNLLWVEPEEIVHPLEEAIHYLVQRGMNTSIYNFPLCLLPRNLWRFARKSISEWKNSFDQECLTCSVKTECAGVFDSGIDLYRRHLRPLPYLLSPE